MGNFFPDISALQIAIQFVLGMIIIIILYIITLVMLNIDRIVLSADTKVTAKQMTKIIDGFVSISYLNNKSYNTVTPMSSTFRKIPKSINTAGGAQFTYQYWMRVEDANDALFEDLIVLLKGDDRKFDVGYYDNISGSNKHLETKASQYVIACPMIKFNKSYRDLSIMVNTSKNPFVNVNISMNNQPGSPGNQNLLSLLSLKSWYLFSFVFKDNISSDRSTEDGINLTMYVNDTAYYTFTPSDVPEFRGNTLKQNEGNLYLFPNVENGTDFLKIGNITYYNYALSTNDVINVFNNGPPTNSLIVEKKDNNSAAYLSAYNKIDIYNY